MATPTLTCANASFSATSMTYPSAADVRWPKCLRHLERDSWRLAVTGVFSAATGNYYTATDIAPVSKRLRRHGWFPMRAPQLWSAIPTLSRASGTLFNTCCVCAQHGRGNIRNAHVTTSKPGITRLGHLSGETVCNQRAKASRVPRGILQHTQPRELICLDSLARSAPNNPLEQVSPTWLPLAARRARQIQFARSFTSDKA